jgi:hypothetical protein
VARSLIQTASCTLALAAVSTFGDFVWARFLPEHEPIYGLLHGLLLGGIFGLALGLVRGRPAAGAFGGAAIIFGAALGFYALRPLLGYAAMFLLWMVLWLGFAFLSGRWLAALQPVGEALGRGGLAAASSGLGFYAVSGIWSGFDPKTIDYAYHFACWGVAFAPGFLALLLERRASR